MNITEYTKVKVYTIVISFFIIQMMTYTVEQVRHNLCYSKGIYGLIHSSISRGSPMCNMLDRISHASVEYNSNILNSILV